MFPVVKEPVLKCCTCSEYFENVKCLREHQMLRHGQADSGAVWPEGTHVLPHSSDPPEIQDWRPRFNFSVTLAEILYSWGFLRRKTSQTDRERLVIAEAATAKENGHSSENIELSTFNKFGGSTEQAASCNLLSSSPIHLSSCSLLCDSGPLQAMTSATTGLDSASLKSFVWPEVHGSESGMGHEFFASDVCYPTWCDRCGDLLWGLQGEYLRCQNCHYTCHPQCRDLVTLDCSPAEERTVVDVDPRLPDHAPQHTSEEPAESEDEAASGPACEMSCEDQGSLSSDEQRVAAAQPVFDITMEEDGASFRGFIRVHMNLCRPISVVAGTRPPSIYDILKEDSLLDRTLTSFYLPRDTVKALHITSTTTTSQVIAALLKKFKVVDNPRKFVLYERHYEDGETSKVKMRRIADNETPLNLALRWSKDLNCNKMFVLQENDTGDILWEAFSLPELGNFLRILDREEEEYKRQVRLKYQQIALKIREAMERLVPAQSAAEDEASAASVAHAG